ncbi:MAG: protease modulator HflC [Proteobacteria bacterium]|nr:protease modulator HflC [Pseudomonadota bacterium]
MNILRNGMSTIAGIVVVGLSMSVFTVEQYEKAIKLQLGQVVDADYQPGLHFKLPFINNVIKFDGRIQTLDAEPERYLTLEKKNLIVDSFVKWRIADVQQFYISMGGDIRRANLRLAQIIKDGLRAEFAARTVQDVIAGDRSKLVEGIEAAANRQAKEFGIELIDVRLKRIDLPKEVSESVYRRMEAERIRVAKDLRSQGSEAAERIRADSDRQRTVLLAEAYKEAEKLRGDGDAKATEIYANAHSKNADFFSFYRSLSVYREAFKDKHDVLVLDSDADFLRFLRQPSGK